MSIVLRIVIGLLVAAAFAVALVPVLVVLDLVEGGSGWGLCPSGVADCETSYFSGFELVAMGILVLAVLLGLIRGAVVLLRWVEKRQDQRMPTA